MTTIQYLDACCGAGKTYAIVRYIAEKVKAGQRFIFVEPTKKMLDDVEVDLRRVDPTIHIEKFYEGLTDSGVVQSVVEHFNNPPDINHVVLITARTLDLIPYFNRPRDWDMVIDEAISVFDMFDPTISVNHRIFTDCIDLSMHGETQEYSEIIVRDDTKLKIIAENRYNDDVYKVFKEIATKVRSDDYVTYVLNSNFYNLLDRTQDTKKLLVFAVRRPKFLRNFSTVLVMAAQFKDTLMYKVWSRMGIDFIEHYELKFSLRKTGHDNGRLVDIRYGYEKDWSATAKNSKENRLAENYIDAAVKCLENRPSLLVRNLKCKKTEYLLQDNRFEELPAKAHGQNRFMNFDNIFVIAAYNLQTSSQLFLSKMYGIDRKSTKKAIMSYEIYQSVTRCSIRDISSTSEKTVIVPDRATAEWLHELFPGSSCESLGLEQHVLKKIGRKAVHSSPAEKQRFSREKLKQERIGIAEQIEMANQQELRHKFGHERDEYTLKSIDNNVSLFKGTIIEDFKQRDPVKFLCKHEDGPFVGFLRDCFKRRFENKEDNQAITPAFFTRTATDETFTASKNVLFANGIWLDLDYTSLLPRDFMKIFPNLNFVAYTTFSHTRECLKYRIYIPTSEIMTNQHYRNIVRQIIHKVEATGGYIEKADPNRPHMKVHGIERKFDASSKFYLPCKPGDGSAGFLRVVEGEGRLPLDVDQWLESSEIPLEDAHTTHDFRVEADSDSSELTPLQRCIRASALEKFSLTPKGSGHFAFYNLNLRLIHAGIRDAEWYNAMYEAAISSNSPAKRLNEMKKYICMSWSMI